ncbi:hypothetical protein F5Y10DRAFT_170921 [Nemania abortiva]|nr:hypothetical protein F5Y10DRAFT_170921 [Nemania abortiva]
MKNFGAILIALAAGASFVAALPAPGTGAHDIETRAPEFYAHHIRSPKGDKKKEHHKFAGNATVSAANNGTDTNNNGNGNGKGKGKGKDNNGQADQGAAAADGNGILDTILGLLDGAVGGGQAGGAAAQGQDPLAILQGLLNGAGAA